ncbi:MAG: hypothetical protein RKU31_38995 [Deltaproteobacteria bacterium]|jgi:hypothetical protein
MANVNGIGNTRTIRDTRGTTNNSVGGAFNNTRFVGDRGRNNFSVGGFQNNTQVNNLGRDDSVDLQGPGWVELVDGNQRDGVVRYQNILNGSTAEIRTDGGRNDAFVRNRVNGANMSVPGGSWNDMMNPAGYLTSYLQGYAAGQSYASQAYAAQQSYAMQQQRDYNSGFQVGNFLTNLALGPMAWFNLFG